LPPPKQVEWGHFTRFWGQNNYPQWSGTRPTERDDWKKQAQQAQQAQMLVLAAGEKKEEPRKRWWSWQK
jgi:hypothetical protein